MLNNKNNITINQASENIYTPDNFIFISPGEFIMGSQERAEESPPHKVTIDYPFLIGKYQVTFEEYDLYCVATGKEKPKDEDYARGMHPVIHVSWEDATSYCEWMSQKEGKAYRLPTEAEWEYVCRANTATRWSFGDNEHNLAEYAWYYENSQDKTHPVGSKKANPWGLYDMHGNVWEWCEDWYDETYAHASNYGSANRIGRKSKKVVRGGSWADIAIGTRSTHRSNANIDGRYYGIGFRLVAQYQNIEKANDSIIENIGSSKSILSNIITYSAPSDESFNETYEFRASSNKSVPPTLIDTFICDVWQRLDFDLNKNLKNITINDIRDALAIYLNRSAYEIAGYRPWTHSCFIKSLDSDEIRVLAQEIFEYEKEYGVRNIKEE